MKVALTPSAPCGNRAASSWTWAGAIGRTVSRGSRSSAERSGSVVQRSGRSQDVHPDHGRLTLPASSCHFANVSKRLFQLQAAKRSSLLQTTWLQCGSTTTASAVAFAGMRHSSSADYFMRRRLRRRSARVARSIEFRNQWQNERIVSKLLALHHSFDCPAQSRDVQFKQGAVRVDEQDVKGPNKCKNPIQLNPATVDFRAVLIYISFDRNGQLP